MTTTYTSDGTSGGTSGRVGSPGRREPTPDRRSPGIGRWVLALAFLVLLTEQTALGFTLIAPALGQFAAKYDTTEVAWMITIFLLVAAVLTPVLGKLGDRFGKKRILVAAGLVGFVGAVVCALAPTYGVMLVGRALMGVSGAFMPLAYALIRDVFPEHFRNLAIAITTNGVGVVTVAGPFLAGFLIDNVSLESVFWFVAAISIVGAIGTALVVPESPVRNLSRLDLPGAIGLAAGIFLIMYGVSNLGLWSLIDGRTLATLGGGLTILIAWWAWEWRTEHPFVDTRLLASRPVATVVLTFALATAAITVGSSYLPTMLQTPRELGIDYGFGIDATGVALYLIPAGVLTVVGGLVVGILAGRTGFKPFLTLGSALIAVGSLVLAFLQTQSWTPIVGYGLIGLGAMVYAAGAGLIVTLAPEASRGVAAGMMAAIAGAIGSAVAQVCGLVLQQNVGQVIEGYPVFTASGWTTIFLIGAGVAIMAIATSLLIPRRERRVHTMHDDPVTVVVS